MIITCEECSTRFTLDDSLVKPDGSKVRCSLCKHIFTVLPEIPEETDTPEEIREEIQDDIEFDAPETPSQDMDGSLDIPFETSLSPQELELEDSIDFDDVGFDEDLDFSNEDLQSEDLQSEGDDLSSESLSSESLELDSQEPEDTEIQSLEDSSAIETPNPETADIDFQDTELEFQEPDLDFEEDDLGFEEDDLDLGAENLDFEDTLTDSNALGLELEDSGPVNPDTSDSNTEEPGLDFEELDFEMEDLETQTDLDIETSKNTADIEISFDPEEDQEVAQMPLEMEAPETPLEDIEFDSEDLTFDSSDMEFETEASDQGTNEAPADFETDLELSFDDDPDADLVFDEGGPNLDPGLDMDLGPEKDLEQALGLEETEDENISFPESDALELEDDEPDLTLDEMDLTDPSEDLIDSETRLETSQEDQPEGEKFSGYDEILDQGVEPEDEFPDLEEDISIDDFETQDQEDKETVPPEPGASSAQIQQPEPEEPLKKDRRKKRTGMGGPVKLLLLLFLVIITAYVVNLRFGIGIPFLSTIEIPFLTQTLKPEPPPKPALKPIPNEASINGRFVSNDTAGELFIVTGRIENPADIAYSHIRVKGTLITKDKAKTSSQMVFCGNIISEEVLKAGNISDINKQLMVKEGLQNTNVNIKPGGAVQFMLVFSNLPENLTNFTVEVKDFKKHGNK